MKLTRRCRGGTRRQKLSLVRAKAASGAKFAGSAYLPVMGKRMMAEQEEVRNDLRRKENMWEQQLELYDELVAKCPRFERKGKTVPYTSANGYMFSLLNKDGQLGIRFSKEVQQKYIQEFDTTIFKTCGAVMRGYVLIPDHMLEDLDKLSEYLNESYDYVMSLEPK